MQRATLPIVNHTPFPAGADTLGQSWHKTHGNTDRFARRINYLRIAVTDRCNLRCVYCMPEEGTSLLPQQNLLTFEELWRVAKVARALGFEKFRITGGEPLLVRNIVGLVAGLKQAVGDGELVMTTNGVLLAPVAVALKEAGIRRINISLDSPNPERLHALARRNTAHLAWDGFHAALAAGFAKVKVNVVVVPGYNEDDIVAMADLSRRYPVDVRFIEQMPQGSLQKGSFVSAARIAGRLHSAFSLHHARPESPGASAQQVFCGTGFLGTVGIIAPMTHKFCDACQRLRLTPYGDLKGCLLTEGGLNLRRALRDGTSFEGLKALFAYAISQKPLAYNDASFGLDRPMSLIGG